MRKLETDCDCLSERERDGVRERGKEGSVCKSVWVDPCERERGGVRKRKTRTDRQTKRKL